jgi:hypothetical protein
MRRFCSVTSIAALNTPPTPNTGENNDDNDNVSRFSFSVQCVESYAEII